MTDKDPLSDAATAAGAISGGFVTLIGLQMDEVGPDRVTATLAVTGDLLQPYGIVHGGVYCTVVETLASVGAAVWLGDRGQVVGVANHTDFLRATRSGSLHGVATPIHRGRSSQLWLVELADDQGRPVARGQVRLTNLANVADVAMAAPTAAS